MGPLRAPLTTALAGVLTLITQGAFIPQINMCCMPTVQNTTSSPTLLPLSEDTFSYTSVVHVRTLRSLIYAPLCSGY